VYQLASLARWGRKEKFKMAKDERRAKITRLEEQLKAKVVCFLTTDRPGMEQPACFITRDCIKIIEQHLQIEEPQNAIALYLVSHGGDVDVPWPLVNLLRSNCKKLYAVLPYICHSAATVIALGCDELIVGPRAQLSPADPILQVKTGAGESAPVLQFGVEDVNSFVRFVKNTLRRRFSRYGHESLAKLIDRVQPEALGSVNRMYSRTRLIIEKMLHLTSRRYTAKEMDHLISLLTVAYYAHTHLISRQEMETDLHLPLVYAEKLRVSELIWDLYEDYAQEFQSRKIFDMHSELHHSNQNPLTVEIKSKFVESAKRTDVFVQTMILQGTGVPNFNFTIPQIPGLQDPSILQQLVQHLMGELNTQLRPFLVAKKLSSFGEWRTE
jgi:hypothetical protein